VPDTNGAIGTIFDILTTGSPLKSKPVRDAVNAIAGALATFPDPHAQGFGVALAGLTKVFELRDSKKKKRGKQ